MPSARMNPSPAKAFRLLTARLCGIATTALCVASVVTATPPSALDLSGRDIPLRVATAAEAATRLRGGGTGRAELTAAVAIPADKAAKGFGYGLLVPAGDEARVTINGRPLDIDPVPRGDAALFQIPAGAFRPGSNIVTVARDSAAGITSADTNAANPAAWTGTTLFSLSDSVEEAHFAQAFRDTSGGPAGPAGPRATPRVGPPPSPEQAKYDVISYDCAFTPSTTASSLTAASVTMRARSLNGTLQAVVLDFDYNSGNMNILGVDSGPATAAIPFTTDLPNLRLTINLPAAVPAGAEFQVRVRYSGTPASTYTGALARPYTRSIHGSLSHPVIYTASQPYGARRWWPCKDLPDDKATTSVVRITVPTGYETVGNGTLTAKTNNGDGTFTWVWSNSYPIVTYLVAFYASNYQYSTGVYTALDGVTTMTISHALYAENLPFEGAGAAGTIQVMNFFAQTFGEYPNLREKYATASWNIGFGIEHQTCTGMPGANSGANTAASVGDGQTRRNVHELCHHWYGNSVTYRTFDHVWLGEAFATYAEALWFGRNDPATYRAYVESFTYSTTDPIVGPNADGYVGSVQYRRGAWVLHMLRRVTGDTAFFKALKDFAKPTPTGFGLSTAVSADFQSTCEAAAGLSAGAYAPFFTQWLYRPTNGQGPVIPAYGFHGEASKPGSTWEIALRVDQTQGGTTPFTMPIDVQIVDQAGGVRNVTVQDNGFGQDFTLNAGTTRPMELNFDPDNWLLETAALRLNTVGLPDAARSAAYSVAVRATGGTGNYAFGTSAGLLPPGLTLSAAGTLSGTPTANGTYTFPVTVQDGGALTRSTNLTVVVSDPAPPPPLVINEVFYDPNGSGTDAGEFIEIKNTGATPVDIGGCQILLVDGATGGTYAPSPITIPALTTLGAGGHYVIGNAATVGAAVSLNVNLDAILQNGAPDAVVLRSSTGTILDSLCYEADGVFASGASTAIATSRGGTGAVVSTTAGAADNACLARLPDGADTDTNLRDFSNAAPTPGAANQPGFALPFADSFDPAPAAGWRKAFVAVRSVDGGAASRPAASPAGGRMLEVVDVTGGGDVAYLPGGYGRLNATAWLWLPATLAGNGWSVGLGVATRNESTWFSGSAGNALENGFYLEYENGSLGATPSLKAGALPAVTATLRLIAVDSTPALFTGTPNATAITVLGSTTAVTPGAWNRVRIAFDRPAGKIAAYVGDIAANPFHSGNLPVNGPNTAGGVTVGFRENHPGTPVAGEATYLDGLAIDTATGLNAAVPDWSLY